MWLILEAIDQRSPCEQSKNALYPFIRTEKSQMTQLNSKGSNWKAMFTLPYGIKKQRGSPAFFLLLSLRNKLTAWQAARAWTEESLY